MGAGVDVRPVRGRRRTPAYRTLLRAVPWGSVALSTVVALVALTLAAGVLFAGSPSRIAAGVHVAGVNVAGMTSAEAAAVLEERAARFASVAVVFVVGEERFPLRPRDLDARVDWRALADEARAEGIWPVPFRGLKRLELRLFGTNLEPVADVYDPRLAYELERMANAVDRPGRNAAVVLRGLEPSLTPHRNGRTLDRRAAGEIVVRALAGFERDPVALPVRVGPPAVTADELAPVVDQVRTALSAPVGFRWKDATWVMEPAQFAALLELPAKGRSALGIGGRRADRYFGGLARAVDRKPRDASFLVSEDGSVTVRPSRRGRALDVTATKKALLAAALSTDSREAELVVRRIAPRVTTKSLRALGVNRLLASYSTPYSGSANRIHNLKRAVALVHGTTVRPGATFSFNEVVGPRTRRRGFRPAPTIFEREYVDALGGGVSQVATTIFNAAWEAGLRITARTPHTLYIDRYPLGRDATVNYPDVDLKFVNDTKSPIFVQAEAGDTGITISLLGRPTNRRVVSEPGELVEIAPPEVETVPDPTMYVGETLVVEKGQPAREIVVERTVYEGDAVLYEETWRTTYLSEPQLVRAGTIPVPEDPAPPAGSMAPAPSAAPPATTTTQPTTTTASP